MPNRLAPTRTMPTAESKKLVRHFVKTRVVCDTESTAPFHEHWAAAERSPAWRRDMASLLSAPAHRDPANAVRHAIAAEIAALVSAVLTPPASRTEQRLLALESEIATLRRELATVQQRVSESARADAEFEAELSSMLVHDSTSDDSGEDDFDYSAINEELGLGCD